MIVEDGMNIQSMLANATLLKIFKTGTESNDAILIKEALSYNLIGSGQQQSS